MDNNNPILFVYAEEDTYPVWGLQKFKNIRTDVQVINFPLLESTEYIQEVYETNKKSKFPYSLKCDEIKDKANTRIYVLSSDEFKLISEYDYEFFNSLTAFSGFAEGSAITAKKAMDYLQDKVDIVDFKKQKHRLIQIFDKSISSNIEDPTNKEYNILPINKIVIPVNKENVLKYGIVNKEDENNILDSLVIEVPILNKTTLVMLDILANYKLG